MVAMHGRAQFALFPGIDEPVPFVADPPTRDGDNETVRWAQRQFEALQRVIDAQQQRIAQLEASAPGGPNDTWDGA